MENRKQLKKIKFLYWVFFLMLALGLIGLWSMHPKITYNAGQLQLVYTLDEKVNVEKYRIECDAKHRAQLVARYDIGTYQGATLVFPVQRKEIVPLFVSCTP